MWYVLTNQSALLLVMWYVLTNKSALLLVMWYVLTNQSALFQSYSDFLYEWPVL